METKKKLMAAEKKANEEKEKFEENWIKDINVSFLIFLRFTSFFFSTYERLTYSFFFSLFFFVNDICKIFNKMLTYLLSRALKLTLDSPYAVCAVLEKKKQKMELKGTFFCCCCSYSVVKRTREKNHLSSFKCADRHKRQKL